MAVFSPPVEGFVIRNADDAAPLDKRQGSPLFDLTDLSEDQVAMVRDVIRAIRLGLMPDLDQLAQDVDVVVSTARTRLDQAASPRAATRRSM